MKIDEIMNRKVASIRVGASMREAARLVRETQVSDLMVVDADGGFVGVLSEGDLIRSVMPHYDELVSSGAAPTGALELFREKGRKMRNTSVDDLVIRNPITLAPSDDALRAAATMVSKQIRRLPVVERGKLVGTVCRGDIASSTRTSIDSRPRTTSSRSASSMPPRAPCSWSNGRTVPRGSVAMRW